MWISRRQYDATGPSIVKGVASINVDAFLFFGCRPGFHLWFYSPLSLLVYTYTYMTYALVDMHRLPLFLLQVASHYRMTLRHKNLSVFVCKIKVSLRFKHVP